MIFNMEKIKKLEQRNIELKKEFEKTEEKINCLIADNNECFMIIDENDHKIEKLKEIENSQKNIYLKNVKKLNILKEFQL